MSEEALTWLLLLPQICILVTDGKSQDLVDAAAQRVKEQGVKLFAVGEYRAAVWVSWAGPFREHMGEES